MLPSVIPARFHRLQTSGVRFIGVGCLYFLAAHLGLLLATINNNVSPVWPATGIAIACVAILGPQVSPAIFFAALLANLSTHIPTGAAIAIALGNTLEALIAAYVWQRVRDMHALLVHQSEAFAIIVASLAASMINASLGSLTLCWSSAHPCADFYETWITWFCGDFLGGIVLAPLALDLLAMKRFRMSSLKGSVLDLLTLAAVATMTLLIFLMPHWDAARLYLVFPLLLFICWISDSLITNATTAVICGIAVASTYFGISPFHSGSMNQDFINLQLFLGTVGITATFLIGIKKAGLLFLPSLVLLVSWVFCGVIFHSLLDAENKKDEIKFAALTHEAQTAIQKRIETYINALQSGAALFAASDHVNRNEWHAFARSLQILERYPGISAISVVVLVQSGDLAKFMAEAQWDGVAGLKIKSFPEASLSLTGEHFIIKYIEPEAPNKNVLGLDLASEPSRKRAAELSRSTGQAAVTRPVSLVQPEANGPGFILFLPVYRKGSKLLTAEDRRKNLEAWIDVPFVASTFFESILGSLLDEMSVEVLQSGSRIYQSQVQNQMRQPQNSSIAIETEIGQMPFTFVWRKRSQFQSSHDTIAAWAGSVGGVVALCLASLIASLQSVQRRSEEIAKIATAEVLQKKRVLADQALTLARVMNLVPVGIFRTNAAGECQYVNAAWVSISGMTMEESLGRGWFESIHPDDRANLRDQLNDYPSPRQPFKLEFRLLRKDGSIRDIYATSAVDTDADGNILGMMGTVQDFTELKQAQRDSEQQRVIATHASRMSSLGEMAGGIAHEINNPLAIILGKILYLKNISKHPSFNSDQMTAELEKIEQTTLRIVKIIKGLLAFSRSDERVPFVFSTLPGIVEDTLALCREKFLHQGVEIRMGSIPNISIECRAVQISQVLLNLFSNSFDAVVDLPDKWIELRVSEASNHVAIEVIDSGKGISAGLVEKIMEPFFTTKVIGKGTGLGLSIAKGIVEDHGGSLELNQTSVHTHFVVVLPKEQTVSLGRYRENVLRKNR